MDNLKTTLCNTIFILSPDQKKRFQEYLPQKVYRSERNIAVVVALMQACMIALFLAKQNMSLVSIRALTYFGLYIFLFVMTTLAIFLYHYMVMHHQYIAFLWIRRLYAIVLCIWVLGITCLEQTSGNGLGVYCYLLPTTAALLLFSPTECGVIFGGTWISLLCILIALRGETGNIFGDMVNSSFVMVLTVFISYRYYRRMATEFCDRETIANQYEEIQKANQMLQVMVHKDQLTGLYNRHFLLETVNKRFEETKKNGYVGMFLMLDIDYFKQYNDRYGHMQGDECLRRISSIVKRLCKEDGASAIRYGGEEFLLIKMAEHMFDALGFASRLQDELVKENIVRDDVAQKRVTVSMGVWQKKLQSTDNIEEMIKVADEALYRAKSMGRDRIEEGVTDAINDERQGGNGV